MKIMSLYQLTEDQKFKNLKSPLQILNLTNLLDLKKTRNQNHPPAKVVVGDKSSLIKMR